jgi:hypothetical protein
VAFHPGGLNATIGAQRNLHTVAPTDNFKATICGGHFVDSGENGEVFDIFDVGVCIGINMGIETALGIRE